jgi:hypothetical protein
MFLKPEITHNFSFKNPDILKVKFRFMKACPYGLGCYRKRPEHFHEFSHPAEHKIANRFKAQEEKKSKKFDLGESKRTDKENIVNKNDSEKLNRRNENELLLSEQYGLYFTKIDGIKRFELSLRIYKEY